DELQDVVMMPLADLAQLAIAGKNRVAGRRRIVVGESNILAGDDGDGHGALQVSAGRAASAVLPCPQALPRPITRFAERRSGCGPQFRRGPLSRIRLKSLKSIVTEGAGELRWDHPDDRRSLRPGRQRTEHRCCRRSAAEQCDERATFHVWMAPAWQEIIWRAAQRSLAVMCPACWCSPGGLLALMGC